MKSLSEAAIWDSTAIIQMRKKWGWYKRWREVDET